MTEGLQQPRTVLLELAEYRDGVATYAADPVPTLSGEGLDGVTVTLGRSSWDKLGRPPFVVVSYVVEAAK